VMGRFCRQGKACRYNSPATFRRTEQKRAENSVDQYTRSIWTRSMARFGILSPQELCFVKIAERWKKESAGKTSALG